VLAIVLTAVLAVDVDAGLPPLPSALFKSVSEASGLLEVEVPLVSTEASMARWEHGVPRLRVLGLVASRAPMDAPGELQLKPWPVMRSCLRLMEGRKSVKALLVLRGSPVVPSVVPMATFGLGLESTPGYAQLKAAIVASFAWRPDASWADQRAALISDNPYLRHLAAEFLMQYAAGAVLDEAWGPQGSASRQKAERSAQFAPDCTISSPRP